jgi:uncharacterized membrane protein
MAVMVPPGGAMHAQSGAAATALAIAWTGRPARCGAGRQRLTRRLGAKTRAQTMPTTYDQLAGRSVERLAALSDGIFGVAMTLLLLELHVPARETIHSESELWHALGALAPQLVVYLMSFLTLGIFWVGQQTQLSHLTGSDRHLTWIHLLILFAITLMPFSTRLLAEFITFRAALLAYWANIAVLGLLLYASWRWARSAALIDPEFAPELQAVICRRIVHAQSWYAAGAALCAVSSWLSIAWIVCVQLTYVISPRFSAR